jgi:hypothetical protein
MNIQPENFSEHHACGLRNICDQIASSEQERKSCEALSYNPHGSTAANFRESFVNTTFDASFR